MVSWPATAVVAYFNFFPSDVLSPVQMLASVDVVPHCIQYNEGAKPRDDWEWERTHTGYELECGACTNETMKVELCDGRISSQRLLDSSSSSSRGASEQYM